MDGIIIIDKPTGDTSFSLVKKFKVVTGEKVGHAGTLDPLASGVLSPQEVLPVDGLNHRLK